MVYRILRIRFGPRWVFFNIYEIFILNICRFSYIRKRSYKCRQILSKWKYSITNELFASTNLFEFLFQIERINDFPLLLILSERAGNHCPYGHSGPDFGPVLHSDVISLILGPTPPELGGVESRAEFPQNPAPPDAHVIALWPESREPRETLHREAGSDPLPLPLSPVAQPVSGTDVGVALTPPVPPTVQRREFSVTHGAAWIPVFWLSSVISRQLCAHHCNDPIQTNIDFASLMMLRRVNESLGLNAFEQTMPKGQFFLKWIH